MCEPGVVKTTAVEVCSVLPFEEGAVVCEIEPVPVVAVPGRIIIIGISGEIGFTDSRCGIVATLIHRRSGSVCIGIDDRARGIDPGCGYAQTYAGADIYLGITLGSDEAGGEYGCEDK